MTPGGVSDDGRLALVPGHPQTLRPLRYGDPLVLVGITVLGDPLPTQLQGRHLPHRSLPGLQLPLFQYLSESTMVKRSLPKQNVESMDLSILVTKKDPHPVSVEV